MRSQAARLRSAISPLPRSASPTRNTLLQCNYLHTSHASRQPRRLPNDRARETWVPNTASEDPKPPSLVDLIRQKGISVMQYSEDEVDGHRILPPSTGGPPPDDPETPAQPKRTRTRKVTVSEEDANTPLPPLELPPIVLQKTQFEQGACVPSYERLAFATTDQLADPHSTAADSSNAIECFIPPPRMIGEIREKLLATFHPHVQRQSLAQIQDANSSVPRELTFALYCPIEGGNYVLDATLAHVANSTMSSVLVIEGEQLAAGECGAYGPDAAPFRLSPNPLDTPPETDDYPPNRPSSPDNDDDSNPAYQMMSAPTMSISIPTITVGQLPPNLRPARTSPLSRKKTHDGRRMRQFFDTLLERRPDGSGEVPWSSRVVYIRDFQLLAPHAATWYPHLVEAVRAARAASDEPITIVFGVSPDLETHRRAAAPETERNDEEAGKKARERELKNWLRQWERSGDSAVRDALPWFDASLNNLSPGNGREVEVREINLMGPEGLNGPPGLGLPMGGILRTLLGGGRRPSSRFPDETEGSRSLYFSVAAVVPITRNKKLEAGERMGRRLQTNRASFRMALHKQGGIVPGASEEWSALRNSWDDLHKEVAPSTSEPHVIQMEEAWKRSLFAQNIMDELATTSLGKALSSDQSFFLPPEARNPQPSTDDAASHNANIDWSAVALAWEQMHQVDVERKQWVADQVHAAHTVSGAVVEDAPPEADDLVERIKADPTLDQHEKRLLGCIVDVGTMPTTFANVHLPVKTIDAIRTMVSLPLLYPEAFSQGVLKNHSMTGALLLGPPGVGKTLLARAVARESGARMLMVKPSDVMDMYVGEGEKLVKSVFSLARRLSPCVIFLDEVDALLASRISSRESGSAIAHRSVITEFMQEMDGLKTNKSQGNVVVIGATNRPFDLDDAVLRRLPRRLLIDLPGEKERLEILKIHLKGEMLWPNVDLVGIAKRTDMYSGSDLKNLCIAAALDSIKESVVLPWETVQDANDPTIKDSTLAQPDMLKSVVEQPRMLHPRNFERALTEITPSSSESLGSLLELRKWNDEFGEGRVQSGGKRTRWGDKFGFGAKPGDAAGGRVMPEHAAP